MIHTAVLVVASPERADAWLRALAARGLAAVAIPATRIDAPDVPVLLRDYAASGDALVVATSPNATRWLPVKAGVGRRAAAVGPETARALAGAGFAVDLVGESGSDDLADRLLERPAGRLLWLRGEDARDAWIERLRAAGWTVSQTTAYRAPPIAGFADAVRRAPARAYVVGSPRAAEALAGALGKVGVAQGLPVVAVGPTTLQAVVRLGFPRGVAAVAPTGDAVASAVASALAGR